METITASKTVEVELETEVELLCNECGAELDTRVDTRRNRLHIIIKPCSACLEAAREEGYDEGVKEGQADD